MDEVITIYQKPTCSKCRATLELLTQSGEKFQSINYYEKPISEDLLRELLQKLNMTAREIFRSDEPAAEGLQSATDEELLKRMAEDPDLIQRPIVVRGDKAILARPHAQVLQLLKKKVCFGGL